MDQNPNSQNQKMGFQNNHGKADNRFAGRDRRHSHEKNQNHEIKDKQGEIAPDQVRFKGQDDKKYSSKQKGVDRISIDVKQQSRNGKNTTSLIQAQSSKQGQNIPAAGNNKFRNSSKNSNHSEILGKHSHSKRIETLEDIKADIERIDKDIQFEIKQIKAVKLGL